MTIRDWALEKEYDFGHMTIGQCIEAAKALNMRVGDVILEEDAEFEGISRQEVAARMRAAFEHNLKACELGLTIAHSSLLGDIGKELNDPQTGIKIIDDDFVNRIVVCTLASQVGNHTIGLRPCAGTGDSCPYTGFVRAVQEFYPGEEELLDRIIAVMLKVGGMYRIGKSTTGCNMEGLGAGCCATAAAFVELAGGTPEAMETAMTLAISPTIAVPCTPRVLAPGLCATHIGGGVLIARLASQLAMHTTIPCGIPVDVMIAMAAQCHLASAEHVVPVTIKYMESFFKRDNRVEAYVKPEVVAAEADRKVQVMHDARLEACDLASRANLITHPFADAVVGGTSEGVGSPTNCARLAHFLAKGEIRKVKVEFCPEMFARRTINIPGVLMAAVNGCGTDDADAYETILSEVQRRGIEVEVLEVPEVPQLQRVTIYASEKNSFVDTLNRAGARLVLRDASAPREEVEALAKSLNIVIIDR
ncbi:MAG: serine dehydratase [Clostridia bacterium]|nr:serine dehydratase [Clostridia bacterium]